MKIFSRIRVHLTAISLTVVGLILSFRQVRAAFPLIPIAAVGGSLPLIGGAAKIGDFKKMAQVALANFLQMKFVLAIVGGVLLALIILYAVVRLRTELRRNRVKRIVARLSGMYAAMMLIKEGDVTGPEKKQTEQSLQKLTDEILLLFEYRFLKKRFKLPTYHLVRSAFKKMKESNMVTDGHIAIVSQYLEIFETMSRW